MLKEAFLDYLRLERNYSERTIVSYGMDLREFEGYLEKTEAELDFTKVHADVVRNWISELMDEGRTATSVNRKLSSLRSFYRFLLRRKEITVNPMLKIVGLKKKKPLPSFVREKDMNRLLDGLSFDEGFEGCRDRTILEMFYATGMRLSELIGLDDVDVDLSARLIKVTGKRNKQRLIPFGDELAEDLLIYIKVRGDAFPDGVEAFFIRKNGKRMYPMQVYRIVKRNLSKVVTLKKKSPHVLRHTFATAMLNDNAELRAVQALLGHESLATTEVYTHTTFEELKKVYEQAHPRA
ncbi:MAG: tyrosine recombinase XerC [Oscillospiraceae bacterium]|nr:tyrosine recombinase XerC [Oscillospiraceae bacterium]